jgi:hypothetical protein
LFLWIRHGSILTESNIWNAQVQCDNWDMSRKSWKNIIFFCWNCDRSLCMCLSPTLRTLSIGYACAMGLINLIDGMRKKSNQRFCLHFSAKPIRMRKTRHHMKFVNKHMGSLQSFAGSCFGGFFFHEINIYVVRKRILLNFLNFVWQ